MSRRDRQRTLRESSAPSTSLPSRRSLRERAAAESAGQTASDPVVLPASVAAEPTPPRRRRDARAAVRSERPTSPEDVPVVEETIALTPVWADPTVDAPDAEPLALPQPADDAALDQPVPADTFVPLSSAADPSAIAASFIAPPSAFHHPRFSPSAGGSAPVPAARAQAQAGAPRPSRWRSLRSPAIIALAVPALLGTVALPAYAFSPGTGSNAIADAALTAQTSAVQSLTVSDDVTLEQIERDGYSATSAEELEQTYAAAGYIYDSAAALAGYLAPSSSGWWRSVPGEITSKYGPRGLICNGAGCSSSFHEGMDFGGACGTPIKAAAAGTVSFTGNAGAFGNRVIIDHGDGLQTIYGHLLGGSYSVAVGDVIEGGTVIAEVGATGVVSGCHLDLKVSVDGEHTNPAPFLREHGVTV